ncbi:hypothetical protein BGW41_004696 [Actinomortierella wolfii]|nr:hypothetical protein BGW41_004696 [Actinomortierella wolfii]
MSTPIDLPELCLLISKSLSLNDLANCVRVCKNWRNNFGVEFAMRLFAAWRQLDTTPYSDHQTSDSAYSQRAHALKQRGFHSEEDLRRHEPYEEPMSPRFRACALLDPMPRDLVRDFRRFGHLIRKLKVNRAWPFSDPTTFCPDLERLHVDVERVALKRVKRGSFVVEDEDQYQHMVNQAMVCIAQTQSLQYLYLRVHTHDEVRAVIRWQHHQSPLDSPHPYLPHLTAADICGPIEPSFVDTLLAACPRLRRLSLLGNHPSLHLSYPIAVRSPLEELTISIRQPTWHALHWATKLPNLRQLTVLLKPFAGTSRLPTFHQLTSLSIQEIDQRYHTTTDDEDVLHTYEGITHILKAIPIGQLKHFSLQTGGHLAWRSLLLSHVLPHARASLVSLSLQIGDNEGGGSIVRQVLEEAAHLQSLKANCPLDATEGLVKPWACAQTLEHLEVVLLCPLVKPLMRSALQRIATCQRLRRLWTTMTATTSTTTTTATPISPISPTSPTITTQVRKLTGKSKVGVFDVSLAAGLIQELVPLTWLESISLVWWGPELVEDRLSETEAEWIVTHFPSLKEIVGLRIALCHEFHQKVLELRPNLTFRYSCRDD